MIITYTKDKWLHQKSVAGKEPPSRDRTSQMYIKFCQEHRLTNIHRSADFRKWSVLFVLCNALIGYTVCLILYVILNVEVLLRVLLYKYHEYSIIEYLTKIETQHKKQSGKTTSSTLNPSNIQTVSYKLSEK